MEKLNVSELKRWLRIDYDDDDLDLQSLIIASEAMISKSTNVDFEKIVLYGEKATELYKLTQIKICGNIYDGKDIIEDNFIISMYMKIECYGLRKLEG